MSLLYRFDRCPIAEFAKTHGYLDIMPAFYNSDYPAMECINAALILLDVGCGTGPMIELLTGEYPDRHFTGLDLTPKMIEEANKKHLSDWKSKRSSGFIWSQGGRHERKIHN